jgi:hypothetical protein
MTVRFGPVAKICQPAINGRFWHIASFRGDGSSSVAFGPKRTFSEQRLPNRIYEYAPWV